MKVLYIGNIGNVLDSFQHKPSVVRYMESVDDFKEVYADLRGMKFSVPLILHDLSLLSFRQSYLLKFIEDFSTNLLCLASRDNMLPTIISRFSKVVKLVEAAPPKERNTLLLDEIFLSETHYINDRQARQLIADNAPTLMPFYLSTIKAKAQRKLLPTKIGVM